MRRGASRRKQSSGEKSEKMRGRVAALTEHTWLAAPSPNGRAVVEAVSGQAKLIVGAARLLSSGVPSAGRHPTSYQGLRRFPCLQLFRLANDFAI
jgi:hypothetical protein